MAHAGARGVRRKLEGGKCHGYMLGVQVHTARGFGFCSTSRWPKPCKPAPYLSDNNPFHCRDLSPKPELSYRVLGVLGLQATLHA